MQSSLYAFILGSVTLVAVFQVAPGSVQAEQPANPGSIVEGAGFTLYDMESIKGFDAEKLERDPVCDRSRRPKIHKVEPG